MHRHRTILELETKMPLIVPGLVEPKSQSQQTAQKEEKHEDKSEERSSTQKKEESSSEGERKSDGMSDEARRKFEEAMELEYQKREGGA